MDNIKTEEDYRKALKLIDSLIDSKEGSEEFRMLEIISGAVNEYENKHYKI